MEIYSKFIGDNNKTFIKCFVNNSNVPNVIFFMTPIASVEHEIAMMNYKPLFEKGFNVFAIDLPGIGNSSNDKFSYNNIKVAITNTVEYIKSNYSDSIHLYGGTGTGGIIAQAIASDKEMLFFKSFSQFGVANHKDLSFIGNSILLKLFFPMLRIFTKIFPKYRVKFKLPKYNGHNAVKENNWYRNVMEKNPGIFDLPLEVVYTLLWLLISKDSPLKEMPHSPTLVMAAKYDRYFKEAYINKYYYKLETDKRLHWIEDSHCVFAWGTIELTNKVADWINERENKILS
ncbi:MAG: hypothetical protein CVU98_01960 [Firmicutes bacterium HGW-Firmicutes-3]|jgi:pimeloyl-ACP methyl ester carboxylesterase|nr:MAG: hypothetical protein CVU98_01960 [Firmicutes bacterium HGW-Firmicutes-3]